MIRLKGASAKYLEHGWKKGGHRSFWSTQPYASLNLPLSPTTNDLVLILRWMPRWSMDEGEKQPIEIYVNSNHLSDVALTNASMENYQLQIPKDMIQGDNLLITFRIPRTDRTTPMDPKSKPRTAGICLYSLILNENESPPVL